MDVLGCNVVYFGENPTFRKNMLSPSSGSKRKPAKKPAEANLTHSVKIRSNIGRHNLFYCLTYSSILKTEAVSSSVTSGSYELHGVITQALLTMWRE